MWLAQICGYEAEKGGGAQAVRNLVSPVKGIWMSFHSCREPAEVLKQKGLTNYV